MADFPNGKEIASRFMVRAEELSLRSGEAFVTLAKEEGDHLSWVSGELVAVAKGDERARVHLAAQLAGIDFHAKATAYLEAVAWRKAFVEIIKELASEALDLGLALGAKALQGILISMAEG